MTDDKKVGEELLKQNGIEHGALSDTEQSEVRRVLARDRARVTRLKWVVAISWTAAFVGYLGYLLMIPGATDRIPRAPDPDSMARVAVYVAGLLPPLVVLTLITAIVCTVSLVIRTRSLSSREIKASLEEITARLDSLARQQSQMGARGEGKGSE